LVKLVVEIGKRIAVRDIEMQQEPIIDLLRELVDGVKKDEKVAIRLSQKDNDFVEELRKRADDRIEFLQNVKLVPTATIDAGGCILETNYGSIDSTIPERVDRVWRGLMARLPDMRNHKTDIKDSSGDPQPG